MSPEMALVIGFILGILVDRTMLAEKAASMALARRRTGGR